MSLVRRHKPVSPAPRVVTPAELAEVVARVGALEQRLARLIEVLAARGGIDAHEEPRR